MGRVWGEVARSEGGVWESVVLSTVGARVRGGRKGQKGRLTQDAKSSESRFSLFKEPGWDLWQVNVLHQKEKQAHRNQTISQIAPWAKTSEQDDLANRPCGKHEPVQCGNTPHEDPLNVLAWQCSPSSCVASSPRVKLTALSWCPSAMAGCVTGAPRVSGRCTAGAPLAS